MMKTFEPQDCIAALNTLKNGYQLRNKPFTGNQIREGLRNCGLPANNNFWKVFKESGILKKLGRNQYEFARTEPIFVGFLHQIKKDYQKLNRSFIEGRKKKEVVKVEEVVKQTTDTPAIEKDPKAMTQFAIDLLKEQGYQILEPIGIVYKKL